MQFDWTKIDWGALFGSKVVLGAIITIITGIMAMIGHSLPAEQQSQLTNGLSEIFEGLSTLAGVWTLFHRVTAQPDGQTVIIPKKTPGDQP